MIPVNRPEVTDEDVNAVNQTLLDTWISGESPAVKTLEDLLCSTIGSKHAVAVSTGTTACDLLTQALGLNEKSVVVAPATTIISTVAQAARLGSKIRVVDVDPESWCIDTRLVEAALDRGASAVFAVHLYGLVADMETLTSLARSADIPILEDAAEAIGQTFQGAMCGNLGTAGVFSFYANKTVTAGEGGAIVTSDDALADEVRRLRNLCFDPAERFVHQDLGFNARMSGLVAALAHSQLLRLKSLLQRKRRLGQRYLSNLSGHPWLRLPPAEVAGTENAFWVFPVLMEPNSPFKLESLRQHLFEHGVDTRRLFFPLNRQPALLKRDLVIATPTPVADSLWERGFYLPSGVGTTDEEIDYVSDILWATK